MYQSNEMISVKKLLDKLIKPKHPNIIRFDVRAYDTDRMGSIPHVYVYLKDHDDEDELNIDWEIKDVLRYLSIKNHMIRFTLGDDDSASCNQGVLGPLPFR
jgi:hypothetical protein